MPGHYVRTNDDTYVDEFRAHVVQRYKTSEMSGDQWRYHVQLDLMRKGSVVASTGFHNVADTASFLPWFLKIWNEELTGDQVDEWLPLDKKQELLCHQFGCSAPATVVYELVKRFPCNYGHEDDFSFGVELRGFCEEHKTRGDCGLDDADHNYRPHHEKAMFVRCVAKSLAFPRKGSHLPGDCDPGDPSVSCPAERDVYMLADAVGMGLVTDDELLRLGLRPWNAPDEPIFDGHPPAGVLWLLPGSWYAGLPDGLPVVTIMGRTEFFVFGESDDDVMFGVLPYGFVSPV